MVFRKLMYQSGPGETCFKRSFAVTCHRVSIVRLPQSYPGVVTGKEGWSGPKGERFTCLLHLSFSVWSYLDVIPHRSRDLVNASAATCLETGRTN